MASARGLRSTRSANAPESYHTRVACEGQRRVSCRRTRGYICLIVNHSHNFGQNLLNSYVRAKRSTLELGFGILGGLQREVLGFEI